MAQRAKRIEAWSYVELVLQSGEVAVRGEMACIDTTTGEVVIGQASTTLVPIGYFDADLTGDGTAKARVQLFREKWLHWWSNSATDAVDAADIGSDCYIEDATTVAATDGTSTLSAAGKVWAVDSTRGVLVEMAD